MTFVKSQKASEYKKIPRKPHTLVYNLHQESPKVGATVTVIDPSVVMDCCSDDVEETRGDISRRERCNLVSTN